MAKVMLVEDDNNLREIYEARMMAEGYDVVTAKDGEEALVVAKANQPDLVVSDVMMPKISGFEMLDILRNTEGLKDVKVIMLTALGQSDDQLRADKLGADRYLVKSQVTLEDIVQSARDLLEGEAEEFSAIGGAATSEATPGVVAETPVVQTPLASEPVAVASEPVAIAPQPVAVPTPAPIAPEPVAVALAPQFSADTQSTSQEAAAVEAQIEDFIASAPTADPVVAASIPVAAPEPLAPAPVEPVPAPAPEPVAVDDTATVQDDQLMASAVDAFVASADGGVVTPAPTPVTDQTPVADPTKPVVPAGGTKIITPLDASGQPDINQLLAQEEAKEIAAQPAPAPIAVEPPVAPATVVTPVFEDGVAAPQEAPTTYIDAPLPDSVTIVDAPTQDLPSPLDQPTLTPPAMPVAPQPIQPPQVPTQPQAQPAPQPPTPPAAPGQQPFDPNSISL